MTNDFSQAFRWPPQDDAIKRSLLAAFESGQWGNYEGPSCQELVCRLAKLFELEHVQLCSSGTIAVEIALRAVGVKPGDEVILAAYDFPGNFRAIESLRAVPVLVDIDPTCWSLDVESTDMAFSGRTRAMIVSHLHGGIGPLAELVPMAKRHQVSVIEDICQCPGATIDGKKLGTFGDVCAMSFGGSKLLSAGRGGAIGTNSEIVLQRARIYSERGNNAFPLSELQAAVLIPQLDRLAERSRIRREQAGWLADRLEAMDRPQTVVIPKGSCPDFYKIPFRIQNVARKQEIINTLRGEGIVIDHGFNGFVNRSHRRCRKAGELHQANQGVKETMVLHHPCLLSDDFQPICERILEVVSEIDHQDGH